MDRRLHRAAAGERGSPFTTAGWRKMVARLGVAAKLGFKAQPHMFGTLAAFSLRTRAPTRAPCRRTSAIETSSTPCATPNCRPRASRTSGANRSCQLLEERQHIALLQLPTDYHSTCSINAKHLKKRWRAANVVSTP